jgi:hypothetical protein
MCLMESLWFDLAREIERGGESGLTRLRRPVTPPARCDQVDSTRADR